MRMRRMSLDLFYNGVNISRDIAGSVMQFAYTDRASGSSDSISLTMEDRERHWLTDWFPELGARLSATLCGGDWSGENAAVSLPCGEFVIDNPRFSGEGSTVTLQAVSKPADTDFSETKRNKTWENVTLRQIAADIAGAAGLKLEYTGAEVTIESIEQSDKTDSQFISEICKKYGLTVKIYSYKLVVFDREQLKAEDPAFVIDASEMASWSIDHELQGTYTGGEIAYTDPKKEEDLIYKTGETGRWYKSTEKVDSLADAELKLKAALADANHAITSISFTTIWNPSALAGLCFSLLGLGRFDGKYFINSVTHKIDGTTSIEATKVY